MTVSILSRTIFISFLLASGQASKIVCERFESETALCFLEGLPQAAGDQKRVELPNLHKASKCLTVITVAPELNDLDAVAMDLSDLYTDALTQGESEAELDCPLCDKDPAACLWNFEEPTKTPASLSDMYVVCQPFKTKDAAGIAASKIGVLEFMENLGFCSLGGARRSLATVVLIEKTSTGEEWHLLQGKGSAPIHFGRSDLTCGPLKGGFGSERVNHLTKYNLRKLEGPKEAPEYGVPARWFRGLVSEPDKTCGTALVVSLDAGTEADSHAFTWYQEKRNGLDFEKNQKTIPKFLEWAAIVNQKVIL